MKIPDLLKPMRAALSSAAFWALSLLVLGAAAIAVGTGMLFGVGAGFLAGGAIAVTYGAVVLQGMKNG